MFCEEKQNKKDVLISVIQTILISNLRRISIYTGPCQRELLFVRLS